MRLEHNAHRNARANWRAINFLLTVRICSLDNHTSTWVLIHRGHSDIQMEASEAMNCDTFRFVVRGNSG